MRPGLVVVTLVGTIVSSVTCNSEPIPAASTAEATAPTEITWHFTNDAPPKDLEFESLRSLIAAGEVKLANGQEIADPSLWTSVVVAARSGGRYCTATLIGPHVLLTAAHCVDAKVAADPTKTVGGKVRIDGPPLTLTDCKMAPGYAQSPLPKEDAPRSSDDYALCEITGDVGTGILESLASGPGSKKGDAILMSGYGCINIRVAVGTLVFDDGAMKLRVGETDLDAAGVLDSGKQAGSYLRTRAPDTEPILCPGDSGGPAFGGVSVSNQGGPRRRVIAVNSRVSAVPEGGSYVFLSFMSSVGTAAFNGFLDEWKAKHASTRQVCGRDFAPGSHNCRS